MKSDAARQRVIAFDRVDAVLGALVAFGGGIVLLVNLWARTLAEWDEATYAVLARNVVVSGDWLTFHLAGATRFEPPLYVWLEAALFRVFGSSELTARVVSALAGIGVLVLTYAIGRKLHSRLVGLLGAAILLTCYQFVYFARMGMLDTVLTLCIYLALFSYIKVKEGDRRWWYVVGAATAVAVMDKSAGGLIAPLIIGLTSIIDGSALRLLKQPEVWLASGLAVALVLPWFVAMTLIHGSAFIGNYIGYRVATRATQTIDNHGGDLLAYAFVARRFFFPWVYLVPFALFVYLRSLVRREISSPILFVAAVFVFGFFTLVPSKLPWYIIPMWPATCIIIAVFLREAARSTWLGLAAIAFSAAIAAFYVPQSLRVVAGLPIPRLLTFGFLGAAIVIGALLVVRRRPLAPVLVPLAAAFFFLGAAHYIWPVLQPFQSPESVVAKAAAGARHGEKGPLIVFVGTSGVVPRTSVWEHVIFYSERPMRAIYSLADLPTALATDAPRGILVATADLSTVSHLYPSQVIVTSEPFAYVVIRLPAEGTMGSQ